MLSKLSFVVPLFNHLEHSKAMLASLQASIPEGLDYEIVLVDDASTDGTRQWLAGLDGPKLHVMLNETNLGFARATHAGIAKAVGGILALVNNDLIFAPGWLEPMLKVLGDPLLHAGLVGNVQRRVSDDTVDHAGFCVIGWGKLAHEPDLPQKGLSHARVFAVTGACCLIRREVFWAVGGFDENFVNGGEDIDLCLKLKNNGFGIYMAYDSVVRHHVSLSRDRSSLQNERNSRLLQAKWRTQLKQEMVQVWLKQMQAKTSGPVSESVNGLTPSLLATPFAAAQVLSENALMREEARWARLLDNNDPNDGLMRRCRIEGLRRDADGRFFTLTNSRVSLWIEQPHGIDGFYIVGRQTAPAGVELKVTLTINDVQSRTFGLGSQRAFNLGIDSPVVLPGVTNYIEAVFSWAQRGPETTSFPDLNPCSFVTLKHFVIDGKVMDHF